jgi:hypothetical protein
MLLGQSNPAKSSNNRGACFVIFIIHWGIDFCITGKEPRSETFCPLTNLISSLASTVPNFSHQ